MKTRTIKILESFVYIIDDYILIDVINGKVLFRLFKLQEMVKLEVFRPSYFSFINF